MGPLLRMQTKLHFEDLPENVQVQYLQKIALRAENLSSPKYISITLIEQIYRIGIWSERDNSPEGARRPQTGVLAPGDGFPHTRKPWKGERSFVPSALGLLGPCITGAYTPACSLISLSGLCLAGPNNPLNLSNHLEREMDKCKL